MNADSQGEGEGDSVHDEVVEVFKSLSSDKIRQTHNMGKKPVGENTPYPMSLEDRETCLSRVYVRERPKGFIPFEGYIALTDKAARLLMEGGSQEECVQMGKLLHRLGDKFWKLHQNGEGLPQRICECKRGYIPKRGRYCKQCVQEKRRTTWKNEKNRQREKVKE
jgi:hypothetical protein